MAPSWDISEKRLTMPITTKNALSFLILYSSSSFLLIGKSNDTLTADAIDLLACDRSRLRQMRCPRRRDLPFQVAATLRTSAGEAEMGGQQPFAGLSYVFKAITGLTAFKAVSLCSNPHLAAKKSTRAAMVLVEFAIINS